MSVPAGPVTAAPPTIGLTATMRARLSRSASRIPGTARIGRNAGHRITRRQQHKIRRADRLYHSRRRLRIGGAGIANRFHWILVPALNEIFFKAQVSRRSQNPRLHARIAHRQHACLDAKPGRNLGRGLTELSCHRKAAWCEECGWPDRDRQRETTSAVPVAPWHCRQKKVSPFTPQPRSWLSFPASM